MDSFQKWLAAGLALVLFSAPLAQHAAAFSQDDGLDEFLASNNEKPLSNDEVQAAKELGISEAELYRVSSPMTEEQKQAVKLDMYNASKDLEVFSHKADQAMSRLVARAAWTLDRKGYSNDAKQLTTEYEQFYTQAVYYTYLGVVPVNLGDHKPLNQWLADWYDKIEAKIGVTLCKALHLIDIKIMNYGIPVVFNPKGRADIGEKYDLADYQDHAGGHMTSKYSFAYHGLFGATAYWLTDLICWAATMGGGAVFICGLIATGVEWGFDKFISPKAAKLIYCKANGAATAGCEKN